MELSDLRENYPLRGVIRPLLVTEVTRMTGGLVCVAAIDVHTGKMVRPLNPDGTNWPETKWCDGDIMVVGNIISIERHPRVPLLYPHATEDMSLVRAYKAGQISGNDLNEICAALSDNTISEMFDNNQIACKYVNDGTKCRSLGCISVSLDQVNPHVYYDKLRISINDNDGQHYDPPVTEMRTKNVGDANAGLAALQRRLAAHDQDHPVVIRIGLTRGWWGPDQNWDPRRCTIQINGIIEHT